MNWKELAEEIGISRSMLDFIRAGTVPVSPKNLRKIEHAERSVGILTPLDKLLASAKASGDQGTLVGDYAEGSKKNSQSVVAAAPELDQMMNTITASFSDPRKLEKLAKRMLELQKFHDGIAGMVQAQSPVRSTVPVKKKKGMSP